MTSSQIRRSHAIKKQLGIDGATAANRLRKMILFDLVKRLRLDICFRCHRKIKSVNDFTVDHKKEWYKVNKKLFWDLKNIAFSHSFCNTSSARKKRSLHGTARRYEAYGCRCRSCTMANSRKVAAQRLRWKLNGIRKH